MIEKENHTFAEPFVLGTIEVLRIQCQTVVKAGDPVPVGPLENWVADISGVISVRSSFFNGFFAISFPKSTYLRILSKMLGDKFTELTPEIHDGASELTNIIFGYAKRILTQNAHVVEMALPRIVVGKFTPPPDEGPLTRIRIPCESNLGSFSVELGVITGPEKR